MASEGTNGGRDDQNSDRETGGAQENHAEPPNAPNDEKPHEAGTARPDGSATKHGTPEPAANASDAHEPEPAPQKQEEDEEEGATPTGHADDGNEKRGAPAPASARTNATERAANEPRDGTPEGGAKAATENTRRRDDGRAARTAASTPGAHPTSTDEEEEAEEARTARHADKEAGATEREPEKPTTGAPERAATAEEGKGDNITATQPRASPPARRKAGRKTKFACDDLVFRPAFRGASDRTAKDRDGTSPSFGKGQSAESGDGACAGNKSQGPRRNDKTIFSPACGIKEKIVLAEREARALTLF